MMLIEDAVSGDYCKEENSVLKNSIDILNNINSTQSEIIASQKSIRLLADSAISSMATSVNQCEESLEAERRSSAAHREGKRIWRVAAIALMAFKLMDLTTN